MHELSLGVLTLLITSMLGCQLIGDITQDNISCSQFLMLSFQVFNLPKVIWDSIPVSMYDLCQSISSFIMYSTGVNSDFFKSQFEVSLVGEFLISGLRLLHALMVDSRKDFSYEAFLVVHTGLFSLCLRLCVWF